MKMRTWLTVLAVAGWLLCVLSGSVLAAEQTLQVPGEYSSIQEAIEAARSGDTIVVAPGVYRERINFTGKQVILTSTNPADPEVVAGTVLDGEGGGSVVRIERGEGSGAVLTGFTIRGGRARRGGGVHIAGFASPVIEYNVVSGNHALERGGGVFIYRSSPVVRHNLVIDNSSDLGGGGIDACSRSNPVIEGNTVIGNRAKMWGGGIYVANSTPTVIDNTLEDNHAEEGGGLYVNSMSTVLDQEGNGWPRENRPPFEGPDPGGNTYGENTQGDPAAQGEGSQVWFD